MRTSSAIGSGRSFGQPRTFSAGLLGKEQTGGRQPNGRSRPNRPWRSVQWESLRQAKVTWDGLPFTFDMRGVEAIKVGCTVA